MPKSDLKVTIKPGKDALRLAMIGETHFDMDSANEHVAEVLRHKPTAVIIDATKLSFISSTGICFLINLRNAMRAAKGTITLVGLQPLVKKALESAHVLKLFDVENAPEKD